ncbi:MAG: molecular chaperone [Planctomycetota bacterium]|nr:MAG: molecular chaperone [Planctomycetota bacterium]
MNIIPWLSKREDRLGTASPENAVARFRNEMDHLFERFFTDPFGPPMDRGQSLFGPRVDLAESDNEITVKAELPGINPKDVDLRVEGNVLMIRGEKKQEKEEQRRNYHYVERQYGSFQRSIPLPTGVDPDKVEAAYKDGVLTVTMAKRPDAKARRITVKTA